MDWKLQLFHWVRDKHKLYNLSNSNDLVHEQSDSQLGHNQSIQFPLVGTIVVAYDPLTSTKTIAELYELSDGEGIDLIVITEPEWLGNLYHCQRNISRRIGHE